MSLQAVSPAPNNAAHSGVYAGDSKDVYAFSATDGFVMERGFADIELREATTVSRFDVTNAVQLKVAASVFNDKLGTFDTADDCFKISGVETTSVEFTSDNFRAALGSIDDVISVGALTTLYSDFKAYVGTYFGFNGGFETLFAAASEFTIDDANSTFNAASLVALIGGAAANDATHPYTKVMTGSITISNITQLLRFAVDSNCFGNRDPTNSAALGDATNYGVNSGFLPNDLIWVPAGITVTLKLHIDAEALLPINNRGSTYAQTTNVTEGLFQSDTTATTTLIEREVKVPMLIRLK